MRHFTVTGMRDARAHGGDAVRHELRLGHQAGAEAALLHAVARAADIEIDLVVAEVLRRWRRSISEIGGITAAQLQRDRSAPPRRTPSRRSRVAVQQRAAWSPSPYRAAPRRVRRRWKDRQCRSVQSIIGATAKICVFFSCT